MVYAIRYLRLYARAIVSKSLVVGAGVEDNQVLISIADLSAMLQRSKAALFRDISEGRLPKHIKLGRQVRWTKSSIDQWIAGGCQHQNADPKAGDA